MAALAASLLLAISARTASSQTVRGQLTDPGTGETVEGALVLLVAESGADVGGSLTNHAGRLVLLLFGEQGGQ